jgi:hypothetical protein
MNALTTLSPEDLPTRFFIDVAVGVSPFEEICQAYGLDHTQVTTLAEDPVFAQRAVLAKQSVEEDGRAFRARCRTVVHEALPRMHAIIHDPDVPASTQVNAFQALVKYGKLEPETEQANQGGNYLSLTIIAPGGESHVCGQTIDLSELAWAPA